MNSAKSLVARVCVAVIGLTIGVGGVTAATSTATADPISVGRGCDEGIQAAGGFPTASTCDTCCNNALGSGASSTDKLTCRQSCLNELPTPAPTATPVPTGATAD